MTALGVVRAPHLAPGDVRWAEVPSVPIAGPVGPIATLQAAWNEQAFLARVHVRDTSPLKNSATAPELLFKGGDAVGFTFGAPGGGKGGEQKVLFALVGDVLCATLYRPVSKEKRPYTFKSPVGEVTFDYVAPLGAPVPFRLARDGDGYTLEANVPWTLLGLSPAAGMELPFDVEIVFSDAAGSANAYVAWWHSRSADAAATFDIPTEAKLYPAEWGKLLLLADPK